MRDGLIVRNDAVPDGMSLARQLGLVPARGLDGRAAAVRRVQRADARRAAGGREAPSSSASPTGVWLLRGGVPRTMNVYLLEDEGGGVTLFDAGIRR